MNKLPDSISLRPLVQEDISAVARIHLAAFPKRALSVLGEESVRRYYEWLLLGPHEAYRIGAFIDGQLAGFCFGGKFNGALSGFLRKNQDYLRRYLFTHPWLLFSSIVRQRIRLVLRLKKRKPANNQTPEAVVAKKKSFGILAIAVSPHFQKQGVGRRLMEEMERVAMAEGFTHMNLSVAKDNHTAIHFYGSLGWVKIFDDGGKWHGSMSKELVG